MAESSALSSDELLRLSHLRALRRAGLWPKPIEQSFADRHAISMIARVEGGHPPDRKIYRCELWRDLKDPESARLEARFQVMAGYPEPPGIDEVLRWLATSAAHVAVADDAPDWNALHGLTATIEPSAIPYRGLVRDAECIDDFAGSLIREASRLRRFLGPAAFAELLAAVDAI